MNPDGPVSQLRAWISQHLDPLDHNTGTLRHSDFDLDPASRPTEPVELSLSAVLVPLVERENGLSVILTRRSAALRRHSGQIALPGGRCDPGETPWATAVREAHEEIGLHPDYVSVVGMTTPYQTGTGYLVTPVVGFVREGFTLVPNADEVAEIFETPFSFLMDPTNHEQRIWEAPSGDRRTYYAITHDDREIWGATAGMLRALYERLFGAAIA